MNIDKMNAAITRYLDAGGKVEKLKTGVARGLTKWEESLWTAQVGYTGRVATNMAASQKKATQKSARRRAANVL